MADVLEVPPPAYTAEQVAAIAASTFGLQGEARDLGSERDQTFLVAEAIVKISNPAEDPAALDLEARAIEHIGRTDARLRVARPLVDPPAVVDGHFVRLFERLEGRTGSGPELDDDALRHFGVTQARLAVAMRGFFHPAAGRELLWDLRNVPRLRPLLECIDGPARRALVAGVLDRWDAEVAPRWPRLRAQVVHGDFTLDNLLVDDRGRVTGIIDFGDMGFTALAGDLAIGLVSLMRGRPGEEALRAARIAMDGYQSRIALEPDELALLGGLVSGRLATLVTISAWRVRRHPENAPYITAWDETSWALLEELDLDTLAHGLGRPRTPTPTDELAVRRGARLGPALTGLTYRRPVHVVRAEGVWLHTADGGRLLDAYNNVPVVGHCHPRVTEAVVRQTRTVNTHSRYLYDPLIELAERLVATMPDGLDTVAVVNSGTEANDLAWRLATAATGQEGGICTSFAYHGVSAVIADFSPEEWPAGHAAERTELISAPGPGVDPAAEMARAIRRLASRRLGLAATYVDGGFTSDGVRLAAPADVQEIVRATRAAGGLFVADEVQAGHGRSGRHLWSFLGYGIVPDVVTLGKPMGNGYPVAAVVTRRELMEELARTTSFFSTFGGNPVAAQAALAVLDVIEDEHVVERAARVSEHLARGLERLRPGAVRANGMLLGVDLASAHHAADVVEAMRDRGVLISRTGPEEDVLKIRPPLSFETEHADLLLEALEDAF